MERAMPMYQFVSNDHDGPVETVVDLPDDAEALDQANTHLPKWWRKFSVAGRRDPSDREY